MPLLTVPFSRFVFGLRFVILFLSLNSFSQSETRNWFFGNSAGLIFSSTLTPATSASGVLSTSLGCASISSATGALLFYTDGSTVYNSSHTAMANGTGLLGKDAAQTAIIVRKPGSATLYYIITVKGIGNSGLNYSIVDMSLASGSGSVTVKNSPLYTSAVEGKLSATKHCNGTDIWILAMDSAYNASNFRSYLLTSSGISTTAVSSSGYGHQGRTNYGTLKLSPNGKKVGLCVNHLSSAYSSGMENKVLLYDFDNTTGVVSNMITVQKEHLPGSPIFYGCEFSPDGSKLYASLWGGIQQWPVCALNTTTTTWPTGLEPTGEYSGTTDYGVLKGALQLAQNGKIYIARPGKDSVGVINFPNLSGNAAGYVPNGKSVGTATCGWGLPNFVSSYFENRALAIPFTYSTSLVNCLSVDFSYEPLCATSGYSLTSRQWLFGDPGSGSANTSTLVSPTHSYSSMGTYTAQLILNYDCNKIDTLIRVVYLTSPSVTVTKPNISCGPITVTAAVSGGVGPYSYTWSPSSQTTSVANNLINGTYTVFAKDNGGGCPATTTVTIQSTFLSAAITTSDVLCYNDASGKAIVNVLGGSGSYTYTWNPGALSTQSVNSLAQGIYTVNAFDQVNFCVTTKTLQINQPAIALSAGLVPSASSVCVSDYIVLNPGAANGTPGYTYVFATGSGTTSSDTIRETIAGNYIYSLTATDANGCVANATTQITFVANPVINVPSVSICSLSTATMSTSGATYFSWMPGSFFANTFTVSPSTTKIYTVTGYDSGCSTTLTTSIVVYALPTVSVFNNGPVCEGQTLQLTANTGTTSTYAWSGPSGFVSSLSNPSFITLPNQSGTYTLDVTDTNSCKRKATTLVTIHPSPSLTISGNFTICVGNKASLTATGADTYSWSDGQLGNKISLSPVTSSTYSVEGLNLATTCKSTNVVTVTVLKCTGLNDLHFSNIKFYPNPTQGELVLETDIAIHLKLVSEIGTLVFEKNFENGSHILNLKAFATGVYYLQISNENLSSFQKIIKIE